MGVSSRGGGITERTFSFNGKERSVAPTGRFNSMHNGHTIAAGKIVKDDQPAQRRTREKLSKSLTYQLSNKEEEGESPVP